MKPLPYIHETVIVTKEMCDHNGHMNVNYYYKLFDSAYTSFYIDELVGNFADDKIKHLQNVYLEQRKMADIPFDIKLHIKDIDE